MSVRGVHCCGDALDVCGSRMLVGSCRTTEQLQLYDVRNGALLAVAPWTPAGPGDRRAAGRCRVYAAQFCPRSGMIAAAGAQGFDGAGEVRILHSDTLASLSSTMLPHAVHSVDLSAHANGIGCRAAVAGGNSAVRVLEVPGLTNASLV